jgi:predicted peptidase
MNTSKYSLSAFLFLTCAIVLSAQKSDGHFITREINHPAIDGYTLWIPDNFNNSDKWPLIYSLHSAAEVGGSIELSLDHGPALAIRNGSAEVRDYLKSRFLVLSPHLKENDYKDAQWYIYTDELNELLSDVIDEFSGDENRVYLTGYSTGGTGTWGYASRHPDKFAAIVPLCSYVQPTQGISEIVTGYEAFSQLPIWVFQNIFDQVISYHPVKNAVETIERNGGDRFLRILHRVEDVGEKFDKVIIKDDQMVDGNSRIFSSYRIYIHDNGYVFENREIYQWMLSHSR